MYFVRKEKRINYTEDYENAVFKIIIIQNVL